MIRQLQFVDCKKHKAWKHDCVNVKNYCPLSTEDNRIRNINTFRFQLLPSSLQALYALFLLRILYFERTFSI